MSKYINPFTDEGFKRIFGRESSKSTLIDFLNALLDGEKHIVDLTYRDKEQISDVDADKCIINVSSMIYSARPTRARI